MRNLRTVITGTAIAAVTGAILLGGCAKATEPFKDAPQSGSRNTAPAEVIEMPDGFNNLATKCDHGNRVYVTFHGNSPYGSVAVVKDDPACP
jgi:hypothetical protein